MTYTIELANRVKNGRVIGNDYVVTRRAIGQTTILFRACTREEVVAWIARQGS